MDIAVCVGQPLQRHACQSPILGAGASRDAPRGAPIGSQLMQVASGEMRAQSGL
jgi:hypothetical protein